MYIELEYGAIHSISLLVNRAFRPIDFCEYLLIFFYSVDEIYVFESRLTVMAVVEIHARINPTSYTK